ncbi:MAG TPA: YceI family protein [Gemmatimonadales bacterium]
MHRSVPLEFPSERLRACRLQEGTRSIRPTPSSASARHKVVGIVRGRFDTTAGTIVVASEPAQCGVDVSIEASTLSTQNAMRDEDVKGRDFFDVGRYPAITYRGKGLRDAGGGRWIVDGTLTVRDVSKVVPLEFRFSGVAPAVPRSPARVGFRAEAAVQRAAFGMTRELLAEIGEASSAPDVWIDIDCEALGAEVSGP